jgi:sugar lactone lactonase YvrE
MPAWPDTRSGRACVAVLVVFELCACGAERADGDAPGADGGFGDVMSDAAARADGAPPSSAPGGSRDDAEAVAGDAGASAAPRADAGTAPRNLVPTLFFLDVTGDRVLRADPATGRSRAIVTRGNAAPDGIAVDPIAGVVYWTNMGVPDANDGFLLRADLSGANVASIVPEASTFTPKQLCLDPEGGFLYWSDREGMRVMRARIDGSDLETLVITGSGAAARADAANWAVGIAVDPRAGYVYWTQKGPDNGRRGSLRRARLALPPGQDPARRSDIEILFAGLPEPVDLALDLAHRHVYWTDRGDNTISRAPLDPPAGVSPDARKDRTIVVRGAGEVIGIALDVPHDSMYYTALEGTVSKAKLDGSAATTLLRDQGSLTGIAHVELPP